MIEVDVVFVTNYDYWEGVYFNGVCVYQGNSIRQSIVVSQLIGKTVKSVITREVDNYWLHNKGGSLPRNLSEVKFVDD